MSSSGTNSSSDIAVVGLACLFPGAPDLGTFWRNIVSGTSAITDPPPEAWDQNLYYDVAADENDRVYCRKGGYLGPLALFDPMEHGIMPRAVEGGEPDQWLALHVARAALRDAGYADGGPHGQRAALILGKGTYANRGTISVVHHGVVVDYTLQLLKSIHPELTEEDLRLVRNDLKRRLPRFDAETAPALIPNVTAGRIANRLDLMGPSYTIDAACASSLVSIDIASKGLRHQEYDLALVGGMQVATPVPVLSLFCRLNALSRSEQIRPFDAKADGTLLSEGVGMAVLKRRADAERDGDRIYAFVKGSGVASDGRAVSVLAPRVEGEELALRLAYEATGISPRTIGLVEAHGTATLVGDAVEVEALGRVFGSRKGAPRCALGSVKSMIGHTMPAAGMAGFIKTALSLYHRVLPPTLGVTEPSPRLKLERTPFYINTETRPWVHGQTHPRRGAVNSFGFGGINAHVILEEVAEVEGTTCETAWESEVFLFGGATRADVIAATREVRTALERRRDVALADLAFSVNGHWRRTGGADTVLGVVATSPQDLARKLERAATRLADSACRKIKDVGGIYFFEEPLARQGRLAFVFPGEGAQYINMLADLCRHFPQMRACFDAMDRHFAGDPRGYVISDLVFPPPFFSDAERLRAEDRLWQLDAAVEALYTANHAVEVLLRDLAIEPDAVLGHSTGEYSAMRAAGMLDEEGYASRLPELNRLYEDASADQTIPTRARLLAIGAPSERVQAMCRRFGDGVAVAMENCPHQTVVVASPEIAAAVEDTLRAEGLLYERLAFDRAVHTPAFAGYARSLHTLLVGLVVRPPAVTLYSATTTRPYPAEMSEVHRIASEHWSRCVEFRKTIEHMYEDGFRLFVEAGPRGNLSAFIDDILAGRSYAAVPANVTRRSGITQINHLAAQLAAHGVPVRVDALYRRRTLTAVDLAAPPSEPANRLGRVKIPTGAPEMRLSAEVAARIRAVARSASQPAPTAATPASPPSLPRGVAVAEPQVVALSPARAPVAELQPVFADEAPSAAPMPEHVMTAFLGTMSSFLELQQDVMAAAINPDSRRHGRWPLIERIVAHHPLHSLVARCTLDLERCPALRDHTLGRAVSGVDAGLLALPIVPFTLMMEVMAEAAASLEGDQVVVGMRHVRAHRWTALDRGPVTIEAHAERIAPGEVMVRVVEPQSNPALVAEGTILLAPAYPEAPYAQALDIPDAEPYTWPSDRLYEEAMFHGPSFRGVQSIDRVGRSAAEASLTVLDRSPLLIDNGGDQLATDFVLLDLPGQVVGFWAAHFLEQGFLVLPFHMASLTLYAPPLTPGEALTCQARIALVGDHQVRSSLDIVQADGRVCARFEGWEDHRFDLPDAARRVLLAPHAARISEPWLVPLRGELEPFAAAKVGPDVLPQAWLIAHGGLWTRVVAMLVLGARERAIWHAMTAFDSRRIEWLMGRIAGKDAVCEYVQRYHGLTLHPADVELLPDEHGRPVIHGAWTDVIAQLPLVSISHVDGTAVAVAGSGAGLVGIGVDLERRGRMTPEMTRIAFTDPETRLLDSVLETERDRWALRLWCAREATAKALGTGLSSVLRACAIDHIDTRSGVVSIRFQRPDTGTLNLVARTAEDGDWIVATCARRTEEGVAR